MIGHRTKAGARLVCCDLCADAKQGRGDTGQRKKMEEKEADWVEGPFTWHKIS